MHVSKLCGGRKGKFCMVYETIFSSCMHPNNIINVLGVAITMQVKLSNHRFIMPLHTQAYSHTRSTEILRHNAESESMGNICLMGLTETILPWLLHIFQCLSCWGTWGQRRHQQWVRTPDPLQLPSAYLGRSPPLLPCNPLRKGGRERWGRRRVCKGGDN